MNRRFACVGDTLERGGQVLPCAGSKNLIRGHQVALIGGQALCKACKSVGTIAKAGGPRRMNFMGEVALDGDIVLCGCSNPARILAKLAGEAWYDDMAAPTSQLSQPANVGQASEDEIFYEIVEAKTDLPVAGMVYKLWSDGQELFDKKSFDEGKTQAFSLDEHPALSFVAWKEGAAR